MFDLSIGLIGLLIAYLSLVIGYLALVSIKDYFTNKTDLQNLVNFLEAKKSLTIYQKSLGKLLNLIARFWGEKKWGKKAISVSYVLAIFYPILFLFFIYLFTGESNFISLAIFPKVHLGMRLLYVIGFGTLIWVFFDVFKDKQKSKLLAWENKFYNFLVKKIGFSKKTWQVIFSLLLALTTYIITKNIYYSIIVFILGIAVAVAVAVAGAFVGVVAFVGAVAGAVAGVGAFAGAGAVAVAVAVAGAGAGAVAVYMGWLNINLGLFIFLIFYFILPLCNALLDWVSMALSRWFMEQAKADKGIGPIVLHLSIDFILAVIFLLGLALAIPLLMEGVNLVFAEQLVAQNIEPVAWREVAIACKKNPWGKDSIAITLMLLTTLIPTLVHFLLALVALYLRLFNYFGNKQATYLKNKEKKLLKKKQGLHSAALRINMYFLIIAFFSISTLGFVAWVIFNFIGFDFPTLIYNCVIWVMGN